MSKKREAVQLCSDDLLKKLKSLENHNKRLNIHFY